MSSLGKYRSFPHLPGLIQMLLSCPQNKPASHVHIPCESAMTTKYAHRLRGQMPWDGFAIALSPDSEHGGMQDPAAAQQGAGGQPAAADGDSAGGGRAARQSGHQRAG